MSVPIAVVGEVPKIRIRSGVIRDPPPMPVIPTSTPIQNPKRTIAGSMGACLVTLAPHLNFFSTFSTLQVESAEYGRITG